MNSFTINEAVRIIRKLEQVSQYPFLSKKCRSEVKAHATVLQRLLDKAVEKAIVIASN